MPPHLKDTKAKLQSIKGAIRWIEMSLEVLRDDVSFLFEFVLLDMINLVSR